MILLLCGGQRSMYVLYVGTESLTYLALYCQNSDFANYLDHYFGKIVFCAMRCGASTAIYGLTGVHGEGHRRFLCLCPCPCTF